MRQLNKTQVEWLKYKQMRELMGYFEIQRIELNWGPNENSEDLGTLTQFFNYLYDNDDELRKMTTLEINEETINRITDSLYYKDDGFEPVAKQKLIKQAKHWEVFK